MTTDDGGQDFVRAGTLADLEAKGGSCSAAGTVRCWWSTTAVGSGARQPLPAHGLPARPGHGRGRHPDLPLAPRPVRPRQRLHLRPVGRRRPDLSRRGARRRGLGRPAFGRADPARPLAPAARGRDGPRPRSRDRQGGASACSRAGVPTGRDRPPGRPVRGAQPRRLGRRADHPDGARQPAAGSCPRRRPTSPCSTAARRVAADCDGQPPRRDRAPLAEAPRPWRRSSAGCGAGSRCGTATGPSARC